MFVISLNDVKDSVSVSSLFVNLFICFIINHLTSLCVRKCWRKLISKLYMRVCVCVFFDI
jgi:hypothetical protein